jgi:hypothetical protein
LAAGADVLGRQLFTVEVGVDDHRGEFGDLDVAALVADAGPWLAVLLMKGATVIIFTIMAIVVVG